MSQSVRRGLASCKCPWLAILRLLWSERKDNCLQVPEEKAVANSQSSSYGAEWLRLGDARAAVEARRAPELSATISGWSCLSRLLANSSSITSADGVRYVSNHITPNRTKSRIVCTLREYAGFKCFSMRHNHISVVAKINRQFFHSGLVTKFWFPAGPQPYALADSMAASAFCAAFSRCPAARASFRNLRSSLHLGPLRITQYRIG